MKKALLLFFTACLYIVPVSAQTPQYVPYQAVARDATGNLLQNTTICVQFRVYNQATGGTLLYEEHNTATTNKLGLFTLNMGQGTRDGGSSSTLGTVSWGSTPAYMEVALDLTGTCSAYTTMGRTQMMSVPYALYAGSAGSAAGPAGGDLTGAYPNPTLVTTGVTANTYGTATTVPQIGVDAKGRITTASNVTISGTAPGGPAGGDLTGTYPDPSLTAVGTAGTYGTSSTYPVVTIDTKGRVTHVATDALPTTLPPSGTAGGDLTGTYPNPGLAAVGTAGTYGTSSTYPVVTVDSKGRVTSVTTDALPTTLPPSGAAGGDLGGTYPSPLVEGIFGKPIVLTGLAANNILQFNGSTWANVSAATAANGTFILNQTSQQASSDFNISGAGTMGGNLSVGGTSYFGGYITGMNGFYPTNNMVRLTPNLHLNSGQHDAVIMNWDNGNSGTDLNFRVGNGAGADVFDVLANGTVGINTNTPGYTLDLNGGSFAFGLGNVRTEQRLDAGLQGNAGAQSGFFQNDGSSVTDYPSGASGWWHLIDCRHSNGGNNYAMQFANGFYDQNLYFRETNNNPAQPWQRVMTSTDVNGTTNYISKFTSGSTIGNSQLFDNGTNVGIATASPQSTFHIVSAGVTKDASSEYNGNVIIQGTSTSRTALTGIGAQLEFVIPANSDGTNPWGQGRIITIPGTSNSGDATGEMILGSRRSYNKTGAGVQWYYGDDIAINGSGNVGIGTPSPNGKLDIYNSTSTYNGDGAVFAPDINADNNFTIQTYIDATGTGGWANRAGYAGGCCNNLALQPDVGTVSIGGVSGNYGSNKFNVTGQSYFNGYVGVNTAAPYRNLDVSAGTGDGITFGQTQDNTETIQTYIDNHWTDRATYASGCCQLLAIQPDVGQVCIGAMTATAKFEINLANPLGWSGNNMAMRIFAPDNGYHMDLNTYIAAGGNVGYQFSPNGNTGMVITTPGLVGIGNKTPAYTLDITGNFHTVSNVTDASYATLNALIDQTNTLNASLGLRLSNNTGAIIFGNGGSNGINVGTIPTPGTYGPVYASGFTVASDITMKKDVQYLGSEDFAKCMEQIRGIQSIRFRYNSESSTHDDKMQYRPNLHLGVVAQSLPVEVADAIQADASGATGEMKLGMSLPDMSGLLLAGVKALDNQQQNMNEIIKAQQAKIDAQQQQIDELKKAMDELRAKK